MLHAPDLAPDTLSMLEVAAGRVRHDAGIGDSELRTGLRRVRRRFEQPLTPLPFAPQWLHGDLVLENVVLAASDLCFTGIVRHPYASTDGRGPPLSDLADLLQSFELQLAVLALELPADEPDALALRDDYRRHFRNALLQAYVRHGGALPQDATLRRRWLRLLRLRSAAFSLAHASTRGGLQLGWVALQHALD